MKNSTSSSSSSNNIGNLVYQEIMERQEFTDEPPTFDADTINDIFNQVINIDDDVMPPPPPPPKLTRQRRMAVTTTTKPTADHPRQAKIGKTMLAYASGGAKSYLGYKLYFLAQPILMKFKEPVRMFKCNITDRMGVANIAAVDKATLQRELRDVSGSLPVTTNKVRDAFTTQEDGEVLFINSKAQLTNYFDYKGNAIDSIPKIFDAKLAILITGMKLDKSNEASYMMRTHQIMVKKATPPPPPTTLLFNVSDDDEDKN